MQLQEGAESDSVPTKIVVTCENSAFDNPTGYEGQRQCVRLRVSGSDLRHC